MLQPSLTACELAGAGAHLPWALAAAGGLERGFTPHARHHQLVRSILKPSDVTYPLARFNHTLPEREDVRKLAKAINGSLADANKQPLADATLDAVFETYWPKLEAKLLEAEATPHQSADPKRDTQEILEELVELARRQEARALRRQPPPLPAPREKKKFVLKVPVYAPDPLPRPPGAPSKEPHDS